MDIPPSKAVEIKTRRSICSVLFAEDGRQTWACGSAGELQRWQTNDGQRVGEPIRVGNGSIYAASLSPDCKWLLCGVLEQGKGYVRVWDTRTFEKVLDIRGHTSSVCSVDISGDSSRFATGSTDHTVIIWNLSTGQKVIGPLQHDDTVVVVRFSPNDDRIATGTATNYGLGSVRIYDGNGRQLHVIPFEFHRHISSPLTWSADGRQLFAISHSEVQRIDTFSGFVVSRWSIPGSSSTASIVLSRDSTFAVVVADKSVSFWDVFTRKQIGNAIQHTGRVLSVALSPKDDCIATGEDNNGVTIRSLHGVIPDSYFVVTTQLPFISVDDTIFNSWTGGDLDRVEELLTEEIADPSCHPSRHARALCQRALIRSRLKKWDTAIDDAKQSIKLEQSAIGYIASAVAHAGKGEHEWALVVFDFAFISGPPTENGLLFLIKAVLLFECGRREYAVTCLDGIIDTVDNKSLYITVRAQMFFLLGGTSLSEGYVEQAIDFFQKARDAFPVQLGPRLVIISLIFGWEFDKLGSGIKKQLQECIKPTTDLGDVALQSKKPDEAIRHFSTALSLGPPNPANILLKRSRAYGTLKLWEMSLVDANEAIKMDSAMAWGYEAKYVALRGLGRYDEAFGAFTHMFDVIEVSTDRAVYDLAKKYVAPAQLMEKIDNVIREVFKTSPIVLIDVMSGRLCDGMGRKSIFKSEHEFSKLRSSMTEKLDEAQIQLVVTKYFGFVMFSHVWEGQEPSFQDVQKAGTVWKLNSLSPPCEKLRNFCEAVRAEGFRWAWSDTVCIDKTTSTVLNQSLKMMYLWYEASAATFVYLADIELLGMVLGLKDSKWLTRAWTLQELLVPKVIRFYTRDWTPYRDAPPHNHKESSEIMQELVDTIGIPRDAVVSFNPDHLSVRQKLRLASARDATREEDVAYSLIGIFRSDIRPDYGEGYAALGHLLEEIVARSGEVTVLDWTGTSSRYNSCLPISLAVYTRTLGPSPVISDAELGAHVSELRNLLSRTDAIQLHAQITSLPPARFANRRLHLPCITFAVRRLGVHNFGNSHDFRYRARVRGLGDVEFHTSDKLSPTEARKLVFVHPWIRNLCDPLDGLSWGDIADDEGDGFEFGPGDESAPSSPLHVTPPTPTDKYTQALRLIARLQRPFRALLLQQQPNGDFKRVAAEHEILVPGMQREISFTSDIRTEVMEVL